MLPLKTCWADEKHLQPDTCGHWGVRNNNHYVCWVSVRKALRVIHINGGLFARQALSFILDVLRDNGDGKITDAL